MSKKIVIVGGGAGSVAAAVAHAMLLNPEVMVTFVDTGEKTDLMTTDGENIYYDPKMIESLKASNSELYNICADIEINNMLRNDRVLVRDENPGMSTDQAYRALCLEHSNGFGEYKLYGNRADVIVEDEVGYFDNLPTNAKKPKFLLEQNHRITKVRR